MNSKDTAKIDVLRAQRSEMGRTRVGTLVKELDRSVIFENASNRNFLR